MHAAYGDGDTKPSWMSMWTAAAVHYRRRDWTTTMTMATGDVFVNLDFSDNLSASILNRINIGAELAGI